MTHEFYSKIINEIWHLSVLLLRLPLKTHIWSHCLMKRVEQCYFKALKTSFVENKGQSGPLSADSKTQGKCQSCLSLKLPLAQTSLPTGKAVTQQRPPNYLSSALVKMVGRGNRLRKRFLLRLLQSFWQCSRHAIVWNKLRSLNINPYWWSTGSSAFLVTGNRK